jgi:hypothetical protein
MADPDAGFTPVVWPMIRGMNSARHCANVRNGSEHDPSVQPLVSPEHWCSVFSDDTTKAGT